MDCGESEWMVNDRLWCIFVVSVAAAKHRGVAEGYRLKRQGSRENGRYFWRACRSRDRHKPAFPRSTPLPARYGEVLAKYLKKRNREQVCAETGLALGCFSLPEVMSLPIGAKPSDRTCRPSIGLIVSPPGVDKDATFH